MFHCVRHNSCDFCLTNSLPDVFSYHHPFFFSFYVVYFIKLWDVKEACTKKTNIVWLKKNRDEAKSWRKLPNLQSLLRYLLQTNYQFHVSAVITSNAIFTWWYVLDIIIKHFRMLLDTNKIKLNALFTVYTTKTFLEKISKLVISIWLHILAY